jgi:hypothetical protein
MEVRGQLRHPPRNSRQYPSCWWLGEGWGVPERVWVIWRKFLARAGKQSRFLGHPGRNPVTTPATPKEYVKRNHPSALIFLSR